MIYPISRQIEGLAARSCSASCSSASSSKNVSSKVLRSQDRLSCLSSRIFAEPYRRDHTHSRALSWTDATGLVWESWMVTALYGHLHIKGPRKLWKLARSGECIGDNTGKNVEPSILAVFATCIGLRQSETKLAKSIPGGQARRFRVGRPCHRITNQIASYIRHAWAASTKDCPRHPLSA